MKKLLIILALSLSMLFAGCANTTRSDTHTDKYVMALDESRGVYKIIDEQTEIICYIWGGAAGSISCVHYGDTCQ